MQWHSPGWVAVAGLACGSLITPSPAHAQDARALHTQALAATCASCHGTQGRAVDGAAVPGLAGMPASYLVEQLKAFRTGSRPATLMHQIAKGYNEAQIESLAAWFAAQKP
jgi:cytochrome c553